MELDAALAEKCAAVYAETKKLDVLRDPELGFEILLGPPRQYPEIVFIGYQPSNAKRDIPIRESRAMGFEDKWPEENGYLKGTYTLAARMRKLFGEDLLSRCVGLNAIFIRAYSLAEYNRLLTTIQRQQIEEFCLNQVRCLLDAMQPRCVVVVGLQTLDLFGRGTVDIRNGKNRPLTKIGTVLGREALAILHLSGARVSSEDAQAIKNRVLSFSRSASHTPRPTAVPQ